MGLVRDSALTGLWENSSLQSLVGVLAGADSWRVRYLKERSNHTYLDDLRAKGPIYSDIYPGDYLYHRQATWGVPAALRTIKKDHNKNRMLHGEV